MTCSHNNYDTRKREYLYIANSIPLWIDNDFPFSDPFTIIIKRKKINKLTADRFQVTGSDYAEV